MALIRIIYPVKNELLEYNKNRSPAVLWKKHLWICDDRDRRSLTKLKGLQQMRYHVEINLFSSLLLPYIFFSSALIILFLCSINDACFARQIAKVNIFAEVQVAA